MRTTLGVPTAAALVALACLGMPAWSKTAAVKTAKTAPATTIFTEQLKGTEQVKGPSPVPLTQTVTVTANRTTKTVTETIGSQTVSGKIVGNHFTINSPGNPSAGSLMASGTIVDNGQALAGTQSQHFGISGIIGDSMTFQPSSASDLMSARAGH